jgi:DNA-binding transcriptional ArsR family regulator
LTDAREKILRRLADGVWRRSKALGHCDALQGLLRAGLVEMKQQGQRQLWKITERGRLTAVMELRK